MGSHSFFGTNEDAVIQDHSIEDNPIANQRIELNTTQKGAASEPESETKESPLMPSESQMVVHGAEGAYLMEKSKWPKLILADECREDDPIETLTQEFAISEDTGSPVNKKLRAVISVMGSDIVELEAEDLMDNVSHRSKGSDLDDPSQGWELSKSKKTKKGKKKKRQGIVASRTSSRIPRDGIPIAEKAARRVMEINNISGMSTKNPFTILNNSSAEVLNSVMLDLDIEVENREEQIDVFRAEELARAAIAEANYKSFIESQKARSAPQNEEELENLTMGVISNQSRGWTELLTKGGEGSNSRQAQKISSLNLSSNEDSILEC